MSARYRLEVIGWAFALMVLSAAALRSFEQHDLMTAGLAVLVAVATVYCLLEVTLREAIEDAKVFALTGHRMPPRAPR